MKHYKLLKNLPTFKAGDEFFINDNGNLMFDSKDCIVTYKASTLEKFPNILKDWFEEILEYKRWRAELDENYWFTDANGYACENMDNRYSIDDYRYNIGNYFKTKEEVEKYKDYLIALQIIKEDTKGFVPDWKDKDQLKYHGYYEHISNSLDWNFNNYSQIQGAIYFKNKEDIKESFKKHRKEWLTVLGVEE